MHTSRLRRAGLTAAPVPAASDPQAPGRPVRVRSAQLATFVLHWLLVAALALCFLSGMRIAADAPDAGPSRVVAMLAPQGEVFSLHLLSAWALVAFLIGYGSLLIRSAAWRRIIVAPARVVALFHGDHRSRWRPVNAVAYWIGLGCLTLAMVTGVQNYLVSAWLPAERVSDVHRLVAWTFLSYPLLHVASQAGIGGWGQLRRMLLPSLNRIGPGLFVATTVVVALGLLYSVHRALPGRLVIEAVATPPTLDGRPDDPIWQRADPVTVQTVGGANLADGQTPVTIRALHDGLRAWFLFQWPDSTRSLKHLPLVKTEAGWKVLQTDFHRHDEDVYYEDKLAVMLSSKAEVPASGTVHLGSSPLAGRPGSAGGRGLHYTTDGSVADVWHWKAVRSGMSMGLADDNHFGPPLEPYTVDPHYWRRAPVQGHEEEAIRYTGGYEKDWHTGGGVGMNWEIFSADTVTPLRLPADPGVLLALGRPNLAAHSSDIGRWWMEVDESLPYTPEADRYPVGTVLPSVLLKGPMTGDRSDVTAQATWEDGHWRLEMSRVLDTGSEHDVPLADGVYLWVAVFDHSQTRHSYHLHPLRLVFR